MATTSPETPPRIDDDPETSEVLRRIGEDLQRIRAEAGTIARLRLDRARLAANEGVHRMLFRAWAGLAGATITVVAAALFALGLAGAITALAGSEPWLGALVAGGLVLLGAFVTLRVMRARMRRGFIEDVERRFGPPRRTTGDRR